MVKCTDDQIACAMVVETKQKFPTLRAVSMDKGFHIPASQEALKPCLECVVLPQKGRLSQADKERESNPEFVNLRKQHSAVKSAINALEIHGLDKCADHGIKGFKRYVALAVLVGNINVWAQCCVSRSKRLLNESVDLIRKLPKEIRLAGGEV